jgi:fructose-bisphosphate aldolase class II
MRELIATRMRDFGQAGHAGDYQPLSLEQMREGYAAAAAAA